jgi:hypothetical protein
MKPFPPRMYPRAPSLAQVQFTLGGFSKRSDFAKFELRQRREEGASRRIKKLAI